MGAAAQILEPLAPRADLERWADEAEQHGGKLTCWGQRFLMAFTWLKGAEEVIEQLPEVEADWEHDAGLNLYEAHLDSVQLEVDAKLRVWFVRWSEDNTETGMSATVEDAKRDAIAAARKLLLEGLAGLQSLEGSR